MGEAEDAPPRGQVRAERVRGAHHRARGDQAELAGGDPVVSRHVGALCLESRAAGDESPERNRSERVVRDERGEHRGRPGHPGPAPEPAEPDCRCREQDRDLARDVVEVDRLLRVDGREQVERELRDERDEHQRRERREHDDRQQQVEQVMRAAVVERHR